MKKETTVLGLDLGVSSIGWSLITQNEQHEPIEILGMGSRIVPLSTDDEDEFRKGKAISKNKQRTQLRTMRKGLNRYQQRRTRLTNTLRQQGMLPDEALIKLPVLALWELRARAATPGAQLSLPELGRVLYHLNQKRGYKHAKGAGSGEDEKGKKEADYVAAVKGRYEELKQCGQTIGQHFAQELKKSECHSEKGAFYTYRIKDQVYPREAYMEEFDRILATQAPYYPEVLTEALIRELRSTIYLQRPLKSCKGLVSFCEFERKQRLVKVRLAGKEGEITYKEHLVDMGPKVAPKSSPLAEVCRLWETINNIRIYHLDGSERPITLEGKQRLFDALQTSDKLTFTQATKLLKLDKEKKDLWCNSLLEGSIKGNTTCAQLRKAFKGYPKHYAELFSFDLEITEGNADPDTGELRPVISESYQQTPLYKLWHILYSIEDRAAMGRALETQLGIARKDLEAGLLDRLFRIDFTKQGYANKSAKFICKLLPFLQLGAMYSEACERAGKQHSALSLTREEIDARPLVDVIPILPRNALRQPIVEKILNQMINLVNEIKKEYGTIDEVRIELARELKMSREEREKTTKSNGKREKENKAIADKISEYGLYPTKARIQKYKLWEETLHKCIYCGNEVNLTSFLRGEGVEVEHIIPRSVLYDDSMSNKTCSCRECNKAKGDMTAKEYIQTLPADKQAAYFKRVEELFGKKEKSAKHARLLMTKDEIPDDFIERHLRLTQYISREAMRILRQAIRQVHASEGGVTAKLRHLWGYDNILKDLNFDRYQSMGETETIAIDRKETERIKDWDKRKDHRHHALDALVVACTSPKHIQRINRVNTEEDIRKMNQETQDREYREKLILLERWLIAQPHLPAHQVKEKVAQILVSFPHPKPGYTKSRNRYTKMVRGRKMRTYQYGILAPREKLTEATIYGKIRLNGEERMVVRYPINALGGKKVVDPALRRIIEEQGGKKGISGPIFSDKAKTQQVRSVRCYATKIKSDKAIPLRVDEQQGRVIAYAKSGNNHHVAIYRDRKGKLQESTITFWHAIERIRFGLPAIITQPRETMQQALAMPDLPASVLARLPQSDWELVETLRKDEMFLIGMTGDEIQQAIKEKDYHTLSEHLYCVQKISSSDYRLRYHLETSVSDEKNTSGRIPKFHRIASFKRYEELTPCKVRINILGQITLADLKK